MLGATCHHIDSRDWEEWEARAADLEADLRMQGRTVYRMPVGGSTVTGTLGYVSAMSEILDDEARLGLDFDALVMSTSENSCWQGPQIGDPGQPPKC